MTTSGYCKIRLLGGRARMGGFVKTSHNLTNVSDDAPITPCSHLNFRFLQSWISFNFNRHHHHHHHHHHLSFLLISDFHAPILNDYVCYSATFADKASHSPVIYTCGRNNQSGDNSMTNEACERKCGGMPSSFSIIITIQCLLLIHSLIHHVHLILAYHITIEHLG